MSDSLVVEIGSLLDGAGIPNALIGAGALAVHGISRSTFDRDLLVTDAKALDQRTWAELTRRLSVDIRRGDQDDPLLGVVRITGSEDRVVDVIVGRHAWQSRLLEESTLVQTTEGSIRVVSAAGLVLLKLYAGGPQDIWDVEQLRQLHGVALDAEVESRVPVLPPAARETWRRIAIS